MNRSNTPASAAHTETPLCPIPRTGTPGSSGLILSILLTVASALFGISLCAVLADTSAMVHQAVWFAVLQAVAIAVSVVLLIHLWRVSRTAKALAPLLAVAAILLASMIRGLAPTFAGAVLIPAALIAFLFVVGEGSALVAVLPKKKLQWVPLIPLIAYAVTVAVCRDPFGAAIALVPFPVMLVLAYGTRHSAEKQDGLTRVGVICATSLTVGLSFLAACALLLYRRLGTLELSVILEKVEDIRAALIQYFTSIEVPENATEAIRKMFTYEYIENMVNGFFNLLPGFAVILVNLLATVAQLIQHAVLRAFGHDASITPRVKTFRMSLISDIVFFVAYLVAVLSGGTESTLIGTVAENIFYILVPGLALAGLLRIISGLTQKGARGYGCLFYLLLILPCFLIVAPAFLAIYEAIANPFALLRARLKPPSDDDPFGKPPQDGGSDHGNSDSQDGGNNLF